jgi:hypothetical protein
MAHSLSPALSSSSELEFTSVHTFESESSNSSASPTTRPRPLDNDNDNDIDSATPSPFDRTKSHSIRKVDKQKPSEKRPERDSHRRLVIQSSILAVLFILINFTFTFEAIDQTLSIF